MAQINSDDLRGYLQNTYKTTRSSATTYWDESVNLTLLNTILNPNTTHETRVTSIKRLIANIYVLVLNVNQYYRSQYLRHLYEHLTDDEIRDDIIYLTLLLTRKVLKHEFDLSKGTLYTYLVNIIKKQSYYLPSEDIRQRKNSITTVTFTELATMVEASSYHNDEASYDHYVETALARYDIYATDIGSAVEEYLIKTAKLRIVLDVLYEHVNEHLYDIIRSLNITQRISEDVYRRRMLAVADIINSVFAKSIYDTFLVRTQYLSQSMGDRILIERFGEHYLQYYDIYANLYDYVFKDPKSIKSDYYKDVKHRIKIIVNATRTLYSHENRFEFNKKIYNYVWDLYLKYLKEFYLS